MRSLMTWLINSIIWVYLISFASYLYYNGHEDKLLRFGLLFFILYLSVGLTSIANKDKLRFSYNRTYTIWVVIIILVLTTISMRYWVVSLAIPPLAFYFFRVRNETRDVSLSDFRDLKKIASRIESTEAMNYIMDRFILLGVAYLASNVLFIDDRVAKNYVPMIIPILTHDIVMIILYFQMEYVPEIEEGSAEEIQT